MVFYCIIFYDYCKQYRIFPAFGINTPSASVSLRISLVGLTSQRAGARRANAQIVTSRTRPLATSRSTIRA
jgi:hypothetical protein